MCRRQHDVSLGMSLLPSSILILEELVMSTVLQKLLREKSVMQELNVGRLRNDLGDYFKKATIHDSNHVNNHRLQ